MFLYREVISVHGVTPFKRCTDETRRDSTPLHSIRRDATWRCYGHLFRRFIDMHLATKEDSSVQGKETMAGGVCGPVPRDPNENASHVRPNVLSVTNASEGSTSKDRSRLGARHSVRTFPKTSKTNRCSFRLGNASTIRRSHRVH